MEPTIHANRIRTARLPNNSIASRPRRRRPPIPMCMLVSNNTRCYNTDQNVVKPKSYSSLMSAKPTATTTKMIATGVQPLDCGVCGWLGGVCCHV